jgi:diguanylate cyclase (GGDEF)-like protein/PAS domain S-box-containing protein
VAVFLCGANLSDWERRQAHASVLQRSRAAYNEFVATATAPVDWPALLENMRKAVPEARFVAVCDQQGHRIAGAGELPLASEPVRPDHLRTTRIIRLPLTSGEIEWGELQLYVPDHPEISVTRAVLGANSPRRIGLGVGSALFAVLGLLVRKRKRVVAKPEAPLPQFIRYLDQLCEGVVIIAADGRIVSCNAAFLRMIGRDVEAVHQQPLSDLPWDRNIWQDGLPWEIAAKKQKQVSECAMTIENPDGESLSLMVSVSPIRDEHDALRGFLATFNDRTEIEQRNTTVLHLLKRLEESRHKLEQKDETLRRQSLIDPLTGMLNRVATIAEAETLFDAGVSVQPLSCIVLGIDHLGEINTQEGQSSGDQLLCQVARLLQSRMPEGHILGRYGGDEFCILLPRCRLEQAAKLANDLRVRIAELKVGQRNISATFGVAATSLSPRDAHQLLVFSDKAMQAGKRWGGNQVRRFDQMPSSDGPPTFGDMVSDVWDRDTQIEPSAQTTEALLTALRARFPAVARHSQRVADLAVGMAGTMISPPDLAVLRTVALLHEVGRLSEKQPLFSTTSDAAQPKGLAMLNAAMSANVGDEILFTAFRSARVMALLNAFRSKTYIKDERLIPLGARLLHVAHAYDELAYGDSSTRIAEDAEILEELRKMEGVKYEPAVIDRLAHYLTRSATLAAQPLPTVSSPIDTTELTPAEYAAS